MNLIFTLVSHLGRPVDIRSDVDYVSSVFAYTKQPESEASALQKEERRKGWTKEGRR